MTFDEFVFFVMHAYSEDDFNDVKDLILMYRTLSTEEREHLVGEFNEHFEEVKGTTAKNVRGNYFKHAKYTISAIGWLNGLEYDEEKKRLQITNSDRVNELVDGFDMFNT